MCMDEAGRKENRQRGSLLTFGIDLKASHCRLFSATVRLLLTAQGRDFHKALVRLGHKSGIIYDDRKDERFLMTVIIRRKANDISFEKLKGNEWMWTKISERHGVLFLFFDSDCSTVAMGAGHSFISQRVEPLHTAKAQKDHITFYYII